MFLRFCAIVHRHSVCAMWAPTKPWETSVNNLRSAPLSRNPFAYRPHTGLRKVEPKAMAETDGEAPPPLPARPPPVPRQTMPMGNNYGYNNYGTNAGYQTPYGGLSSGYGSGYGGYSSGYGGYGMYNNMYGGGYNANRYGLGYTNNNQPTSSFVEQAEQNSRVAFDSIHSIVQAFGSIAMMFESTFFAVHSSFRAVLGVADHFSRLRHNLVQIVGSNFVIKWLRNIFRKILVLIGLRNPSTAEEIWNEVKSVAGQNGTQVWRSWPLLLFFGVVLGTPWVIWKFLSSLGKAVDHDDWMTGDGDHVIGKALFDFIGEGEDELSFSAGDCLRIAPKQQQPKIRGWLLATMNETTKGIVPANYVKILGFKRGKKTKSGGIEVTQPNNASSLIEEEHIEVAENNTVESTIDYEDVFDGSSTGFSEANTTQITSTGGYERNGESVLTTGLEETS